MSVQSNQTTARSAETPSMFSRCIATQGNKIRRVTRQFAGDKRGNIGILFAMAVVPLIALSGAAIDYNGALRIQTTMQGALDAATLAGGRELQVSGDPDVAWETAENYFDAAVSTLVPANFTGDATTPHLTSSQNSSIDMANNTINLTAEATFETVLLKVIGIDEIPIRVQTKGELKQGTGGGGGYENLELSLMLDVTGSMGGSKIAALKASAKDLVQIVIGDGPQNEFTSKVAIAPFAASVNVGSGSTYINVVTGYTQVASLIPGLDILPAAPAGPEFAEMTPRFNTITMGFSSALVQKAHHYSNNPNHWKCNKWKKKGKWWKWNKHCKPQGTPPPVTNCVAERTGTNAYTDVAPQFGQANTLFPNIGDPDEDGELGEADNCTSSSAKIMPLTDDKDELNDAIDDLPASGMTAGHLGIAWAWYLISPKWEALFPVDSKPAEYQGDTKKVVVIMTDGAFNRKYGGSNSYTQAENLCDNMKAEGVEIFTVGFELPSQSARDIMEYCASTPIDAHRFFAESTQELQATYRQIGFSLKDLKLSQ